MLTWIDDDDPLPPTQLALGADSDAPGLLAAGGRLTPQRLDEAYRHGIFPWYSDGQPVLWWSPDPRMVLPVAEFKLSRSLAQDAAPLRRARRAASCASTAPSSASSTPARGTPREGQDGTWIVPRDGARPTPPGTAPAACTASRPGSTASWSAGCTASASAACSSASRCSRARTDASKIALAALVAFCRAHGIALIDCQQNTAPPGLAGRARDAARRRSSATWPARLGEPAVADWTYDPRMWRQLEALRGTAARGRRA